jgi:hypothetical protein
MTPHPSQGGQTSVHKRTRVLLLLFWLAFIIYAGVSLRRTAKDAFARDQVSLLDTGLDQKINDFEGFYRASLRLSRGEIMYFPNTKDREEMPSKHGPFFEFLLLPLVPLGPAWAAVLFQLLSFAALAGTLLLAQRFTQEFAESFWKKAISPWTAIAAFLLLIPFVHLAVRYNQSVFFMLYLTFLGLRTLQKRPLLGGFLLALPGAIKLLPLVLGPWLLWKKQFRPALGWLLGLLISFVPLFLHQGPSLALVQLQSYQHMILQDSSFGAYHERFQGLPAFVNGSLVATYAPDMESAAQKHNWQGRRNFLGNSPLSPYRRQIALFASLLLVLTCAFACRSKRPETLQGWLAELGLVLMAMLLISPHTWKHYLWWFFPAVLYASAAFQSPDPRDRRFGKAFSFVILLTLSLPHRSLFPGILWQTWHVFHGFAIGGTIAFFLLAVYLMKTKAKGGGSLK